MQFNYWPSIAVSLGYVGLVMLACRSAALHRLTRPFAAVGRTALTNYLLQSILCTTIFYGHGLGWFGSVDRVGQVGVVAACLGVAARRLSRSGCAASASGRPSGPGARSPTGCASRCGGRRRPNPHDDASGRFAQAACRRRENGRMTQSWRRARFGMIQAREGTRRSRTRGWPG